MKFELKMPEPGDEMRKFELKMPEPLVKELVGKVSDEELQAVAMMEGMLRIMIWERSQWNYVDIARKVCAVQPMPESASFVYYLEHLKKEKENDGES